MKSEISCMKIITELAHKQRSPRWLSLRKFLIASTSAYNLVPGSDHCASTEEFLLKNCIGAFQKEDGMIKLSNQEHGWKLKSDKELLKLSGPELKPLRKKCG